MGQDFFQQFRILFFPVEFCCGLQFFLMVGEVFPVFDGIVQLGNLFQDFGPFIGRKFPKFILCRFVFEFFQARTFISNFKDTLLSPANVW